MDDEGEDTLFKVRSSVRCSRFFPTTIDGVAHVTAVTSNGRDRGDKSLRWRILIFDFRGFWSKSALTQALVPMQHGVGIKRRSFGPAPGSTAILGVKPTYEFPRIAPRKCDARLSDCHRD